VRGDSSHASAPVGACSQSSSFRAQRLRWRRRKLGFKLEKTDSDIHLAVRDAAGATMVVEFPDKGCTAGAQHRAQMEQARKTLITACGPPSGRFRELKGEAIITGVLFFDFFHHQRGVAPNVAELHPCSPSRGRVREPEGRPRARTR
jgi:hypothetical protein